MTSRAISSFLRDEWFLAVSAATCLAFYLFRDSIFAGLSSPPYLALVFIWLFAVMVGTALKLKVWTTGFPALPGSWIWGIRRLTALADRRKRRGS